MATQTATAVASLQEGGRWVNARPSGEELASWFKENVRLHDGLEHEHYVQGVVLIPQKEKLQETRLAADGSVQVVDAGERLVFTPYPKVETRVAYFWELCRLRGWLGKIEAAHVPRIGGTGSLANEHLPPGFFRYPVQKQDGKWAQLIGCSMQVRTYERDLRSGERGRVLMEPPTGTKIVPALNRWGEDQNAIMKAETGAVGRALGMAGMLVIPGTGLATAEDMQELATGAAGTVGEPADVPASLPDAEPKQEQDAGAGGDLRSRVADLIGELQSDHPDALKAVQEWARERKFDFNDLRDPQLRGVVRKLEKALAEARAAPQVQG